MIVNGRPSIPDSLVQRIATLGSETERARTASAWTRLPRLRWQLRGLELEAARFGPEPQAVARLIIHMLELAESAVEQKSGPCSPDDTLAVASEGLLLLSGTLEGKLDASQLPRFRERVQHRWGEYLDLLVHDLHTPASPFNQDIPLTAGAGESLLQDEQIDDDSEQSYRSRLGRLLGVDVQQNLSNAPRVPAQARPAKAAPAYAAPLTPTPAPPPTPPPAPPSASPTARQPLPEPPPIEEDSILSDPEIADAFRADATELLERIDDLSHQLAKPGCPPETLQELGRSLHTLKGAAGAVGLFEIASKVHELEDEAEEVRKSDGPIDPRFLDDTGALLSLIEDVLARLTPKPQEKPAPPPQAVHASAAGESGGSADSGSPSGSSSGSGSSSSNGSGSPGGSGSVDIIETSTDGMVRVARARLDDLLDISAELLARNPRRASRAARVREVAQAARACRNRLTSSIDKLCELNPNLVAAATTDNVHTDPKRELAGLIRQFTEQAEDLALLAEMARGAAGDLADESESSAFLTDRLWDLLHEIRVVPVRPLLLRLDRVARAAARMEGKQVEVTVAGDENGLDRLVQDRLYEPLLHIVRNSVGHGVESPADREAAGKPPVGQLSLTAERDGEAFVLTVKDDGAGLDFDSIEAKASRLGLIKNGEPVNQERLKQIIFVSGFTTRSSAGGVAGRGIGMDVVAQEVAKLLGTITLDSTRGQGTTVQVRLPARLSLQQVMVVRVDGQTFGLPLHVVAAEGVDENTASPAKIAGPNAPTLSARAALGLPPAPSNAPKAILNLRVGGVSAALEVDSIEGPRELVARPPHPLLAQHPLVSGMSLSADDDVVLLLEPLALVGDPGVTKIEALSARPDPVLLVDDSISVRKTLGRLLKALGLEYEEAVDGLEALEKLNTRHYRVLLTDIDMPRMNGIELMEALARPGPNPRPPIIVTSSRTDSATRKRIVQLGAKGFVPKPAGVEALAEVIGPLLAQQ